MNTPFLTLPQEGRGVRRKKNCVFPVFSLPQNMGWSVAIFFYTLYFFLEKNIWVAFFWGKNFGVAYLGKFFLGRIFLEKCLGRAFGEKKEKTFFGSHF